MVTDDVFGSYRIMSLRTNDLYVLKPHDNNTFKSALIYHRIYRITFLHA